MAFHKTLSQGEKKIKDVIAHSDNKMIDGSTAFMLYDTYGFPLELTIEIAEESGFTVDSEGFQVEMKAQQDRARAARGERESMASQKIDLMDFTTPSTFVYDTAPCKTTVIGLFKDGEKVNELTDEGEIIVETTNFYAEMGGQCADTGSAHSDQFDAEVTNVLKAPNGQHLHYIKLMSGSVHVGDTVELTVDTARRALIENNHTATHLLDAALKNVLGSHVGQAGSYLDENRLRFDFTHPSKMTKEELTAVEDMVNEYIFKGVDVDVKEMPKEEAISAGATALFDEKYGDVVRVVRVGDFSVELCGGTHVSNTAKIGLFKIEMETSVGSGVRRIEAVTNVRAYKALRKSEETLEEVGTVLKANDLNKIVEKAESTMTTLNAMKKEIETLTSKLNALEAKNQASQVEEVNGVKFLYTHVEKDNAAAKQMAFDFRDQLGSGIVVVTSTFEGKNSYFVGITKDLTNTYKAGVLVKAMNEVLDGRGGGKPDFAQGGAPTLDKIDEAITAVKSKL